jgi:hypothetical protein
LHKTKLRINTNNHKHTTNNKFINQAENHRKEIVIVSAFLTPTIMNIIELENRRLKWSKITFKEATSISSLRKCESEIKEIESDIENKVRRPEEYADALMCLFDSAGRQENPITVEEIFEAFEKKLTINENRKWTKNSDNSYSHVKDSNQA